VTGALARGLDEAGLVAEVRRALSGLATGTPAVLAVSGGRDSAGLALLVARARPDLVLSVAHVRHGLRDDAADAAAAAGIAQRLGLPLAVRSVAVRADGEGMEAAARDARHAALAALARGCAARAVLLGHTAEDQAETVLLALGRGTGVRGLGGMRPARDGDGVELLRPLLRLRRADVAAAVAAAGLPTVEDPTNTDPEQRRRRVRTTVLPALAELSGGSGDPVALLTRLADLARDDADLLDELAAAHVRRLVRAWGPVRVVRADALAALHPALRRRVARALLAAVRGTTAGLDAAAVDRTLTLASGDDPVPPPGGRPGPAGEVHVAGGVRVTANGGWLAAAPPALADLPARPLAVPGAVDLPELGLRMTVALTGVAGGGPATLASSTPGRPTGDGVLPPTARAPRGTAGAAVVALGPVALHGLVVRSRQPGDEAPGSSRGLGRRFTDLGVPRALRQLVPVVTTAAGETLWVPGVGVAPVGIRQAAVLVWLERPR